MLVTMIDIRQARPEDSASLSALARASKSHWDYPPQWIAAWREQLTLSPRFIAENHVFAAFDGEALVGCYALTDTDEPNSLELEHMWIHPDAIGRGLGRRLFEHAEAQARKRSIDALFIDSDPYAEPFYLRLGAQRIGATRADMEGVRRELPRLRYTVSG